MSCGGVKSNEKVKKFSELEFFAQVLTEMYVEIQLYKWNVFMYVMQYAQKFELKMHVTYLCKTDYFVLLFLCLT